MPANRRRYKVLVADSVKNSREAVTEILSDAGYDVSSARNGSETIELLTRETYDLIFCDIDMPRTSGLEIVRMAHALNSRSRIIAVSSSGGASSRSAMKKEGAFELLDKPLRKVTLLGMARKALKARSPRTRQEVS